MIFSAFPHIFKLLLLSNFWILASTAPELQLLNVVFRHGDRTPDAETSQLYPNDLHNISSFYPAGYGQLTNIGKMRAYTLGQHLRHLYGNFLSDIYIPDEVNALTTNYDRSKMSLQLVLGGLYPPVELQLWNPNFNWQPTAYDLLSDEQAHMLFPAHSERFWSEIEQVEEIPEVKKRLDGFRDLMLNMTELVGKRLTKIEELFKLYNILICEFYANLELPEWAYGMILDGPLYNAGVFLSHILNYNVSLQKMTGGKILKYFVDNMSSKINGTDGKRKIHLLSAHDFNVVTLLRSLKILNSVVPEFSSAVICELYRDSDNYYVKIRYYNGIPSNTSSEVKLLECDSPCPLEQFLDLYGHVMPTKEEIFD